MVILRFLHRGLKCSCLASETISTFCRQKLRLGCREFISCLASGPKSISVKSFIDLLVVGARQQVNSIDLCICQLIRRKTVDVGLKGIRVVRALAPRLLGGLGLLRQQLFHSLIGILFVISGLRAGEL